MNLSLPENKPKSRMKIIRFLTLLQLFARIFARTDKTSQKPIYRIQAPGQAIIVKIIFELESKAEIFLKYFLKIALDFPTIFKVFLEKSLPFIQSRTYPSEFNFLNIYATFNLTLRELGLTDSNNPILNLSSAFLRKGSMNELKHNALYESRWKLSKTLFTKAF
ncbi:hypothetical protein LEP1GSC127_1165 [Leptospira kirschneri str. 200801925]|nr:hypothetical protein LEP1GSC127_1165 [Leptospira kirschneri str. 200801925]